MSQTFYFYSVLFHSILTAAMRYLAAFLLIVTILTVGLQCEEHRGTNRDRRRNQRRLRSRNVRRPTGILSEHHLSLDLNDGRREESTMPYIKPWTISPDGSEVEVMNKTGGADEDEDIIYEEWLPSPTLSNQQWHTRQR